MSYFKDAPRPSNRKLAPRPIRLTRAARERRRQKTERSPYVSDRVVILVAGDGRRRRYPPVDGMHPRERYELDGLTWTTVTVVARDELTIRRPAAPVEE
jgi:hypothetical protein